MGFPAGQRDASATSSRAVPVLAMWDGGCVMIGSGTEGCGEEAVNNQRPAADGQTRSSGRKRTECLCPL